MSWEPGLITHIDADGMSVKVPTGNDCGACAAKSLCTFQGPDAAYRTLRVAHVEGCAVGDRLMVKEPGSVLAVVLLALVVWPVVLLLTGHGLAVCCAKFPYAVLVLWVSGGTVWVGGLYAANRWITQAPRFQTMARRPASSSNSVPHGDTESNEV